MEKLKVLDFDYGCGGFTKGLEDSGLFEVIYNGSINEKNRVCYNNTHKNSFKEIDILPKEADLVVFTPNLGHKLSGPGSKNFTMTQLNNFTSFATLYDFDNLIFITQREAIPLLHNYSKVLYTNDDLPTRDVISCRLKELRYNVYNFILDGAGFGLPQHKYYNIYWASKVVDDTFKIKEGFGFYRRPYRHVSHLLKGIDDETNLNWHYPNYSKREICSYIAPGQKASNTKELTQKNGYYRLEYDKFAPSLSYDFHNVSSKAPSVHPIYDRPLTIREGARLFGLPDDFIWDYKLKPHEIALMIYESFSPIVSKLLASRLFKLIKKNE